LALNTASCIVSGEYATILPLTRWFVDVILTQSRLHTSYKFGLCSVQKTGTIEKNIFCSYVALTAKTHQCTA